ncbi:Guanine nucleotide exchange factor DBS [Liparis tanakae]|uniref:Guanine nucleotide exchange factor DBS n=1 Tax=Liparis tanakae TaxID=230148 RepID=A0A4Z2GKY8_9TELE|nr:Guanine nucleotide exchange factor DBS [Liparis tanakae]
MQGSFSVWTEHKKGHAKVKDLARFKPMQRHLFLHQKALLFCKRREEYGEGYEKAPSYSFKQSLSMSAVGITENAKGDNKKFEIWCNSREEVYIVQAPTAEVKTTWLNEIRKVLTTQLEACRDEAVTSPTSHRAAVATKRFTLQSFSNLKAQKGSPPSPEHKTKRQSDPTPFGFRGGSPVSRPSVACRLATGLMRDAGARPRAYGSDECWNKASLWPDASEEHDGYSSAEDALNSDPEDDVGKKLRAGKYTVTADYEKEDAPELSVKSGDVVQLVKEGDDGQWLVRNLSSSKESWMAAADLVTLIEKSKSCPSLSSSDCPRQRSRRDAAMCFTADAGSLENTERSEEGGANQG